MIAARKRASGIWEEGKRVARVLRLQTLSQHGTTGIHARKRKNDEEGKKGRMKTGDWEEGPLLPTRIAVVRLPWLPTTTATTTTINSA